MNLRLFINNEPWLPLLVITTTHVKIIHNLTVIIIQNNKIGKVLSRYYRD